MTPVLVNGTEERCCAKYLCGELTTSLKNIFLIYVFVYQNYQYRKVFEMCNYTERENLLINYLLIVYILSCVYIFLKLI